MVLSVLLESGLLFLEVGSLIAAILLELQGRELLVSGAVLAFAGQVLGCLQGWIMIELGWV